MEQEDLLMTSVPLTMVMNSSNLLKIITARKLNWKRGIQEHVALYLTLTSLSSIIFSYKLFEKRDFSYSKCPTGVATYSVLYFIGSFHSKLLRIARCIFWLYTKKVPKYPTVLVKYNMTFTKLWNSILTKGLLY